VGEPQKDSSLIVVPRDRFAWNATERVQGEGVSSEAIDPPDPLRDRASIPRFVGDISDIMQDLSPPAEREP